MVPSERQVPLIIKSILTAHAGTSAAPAPGGSQYTLGFPVYIAGPKHLAMNGSPS